MKQEKPKCKRKKFKIQIIKPLRKHCDCGRKVTDHHLYCNDCISLRDRRRYWKSRENQKGGGFVLKKVEVEA